MSTLFLSPLPSPAVETDPALTARTFSNNPTLKAALARIQQQQRAAQAQTTLQPNQIMVGQESSGCDAAPGDVQPDESPASKLDVP